MKQGWKDGILSDWCQIGAPHIVPCGQPRPQVPVSLDRQRGSSLVAGLLVVLGRSNCCICFVFGKCPDSELQRARAPEIPRWVVELRCVFLGFSRRTRSAFCFIRNWQHVRCGHFSYAWPSAWQKLAGYLNLLERVLTRWSCFRSS